MKKIFVILLICSGLVLAACGDDIAKDEVVDEPAVEEAAAEEVEGEGENQDVYVLSGNWSVSLEVEEDNTTLLNYPGDEELLQGDLTLEQPLMICIGEALEPIYTERDAAGITESQVIDIDISVEIDSDGENGTCHIESDILTDSITVTLKNNQLDPKIATVFIIYPDGCKSVNNGKCTGNPKKPCPPLKLSNKCYKTQCTTYAIKIIAGKIEKYIFLCACSLTNIEVNCP